MQFREIYSIGSLLGEIGGLSGALANVCHILVWILIHKYMNASVASKIYRVEKNPNLTRSFTKSRDEIEDVMNMEES